MTINSKLLDQKQIIEKQHVVIIALENALSDLLIKNHGEDCCKDSDLLKQNSSQMSVIIDNHNDIISDNTNRMEALLMLLDLEKN